MKEFQFGKIQLKVFETRKEMGKAAAEEAGASMRRLLSEQEEINCVFAAAPSQNEFLEALIQEEEIAWDRVNGYHMDEYVGFEIGHPNSFNGFLMKSLFSKVPFKRVYLIDGAADREMEARRYSRLLEETAVDITFMGIGENGHIAFNDPAVANFYDSQTVKIVELDEVCRQQQVNDGCFLSLDAVPEQAITVTVPKLISAKEIFCVVPTAKKKNAVKAALSGEISEACPASILRTVEHVHMYIDSDCFWE